MKCESMDHCYWQLTDRPWNAALNSEVDHLMLTSMKTVFLSRTSVHLERSRIVKNQLKISNIYKIIVQTFGNIILVSSDGTLHWHRFRPRNLREKNLGTCISRNLFQLKRQSIQNFNLTDSTIDLKLFIEN